MRILSRLHHYTSRVWEQFTFGSTPRDDAQHLSRTYEIGNRNRVGPKSARLGASASRQPSEEQPHEFGLAVRVGLLEDVLQVRADGRQ
jgi:hypothetical protein